MEDISAEKLFSGGAVTDIREVLHRRLTRYHSYFGPEELHVDGSTEELQLQTGNECLNILERLQTAWESEVVAGPSSAPASPINPSAGVVGTRDLAQIRTLLSIVFKWAVEPFLSGVANAIPAKADPHTRVHAAPRIIDLTSIPADYTSLTTAVSRLLRLLFPAGVQSAPSQTAIASALANRHLSDLLRPCLVLGWLPKNLATESVRPVDEFRPYVMRILAILPVSQTIAALGIILSDSSISLPYARKSCSFLLSRQLLRPEGIPGLLSAVFGEEDMSGEDAPLEKLEHVGRLLTTVPASMKPEDYYATIIPKLLVLLSADANRIPPVHRRAVAFSLSRMLADEQRDEGGLVSKILLSSLHRPFIVLPREDAADGINTDTSDSSRATEHPVPSSALSSIQTLLTNADPSPTFITNLLTPIVPPLYAILSHLEANKTSDPALRESVRGLLSTWGRVVGAAEGIAALWLVVQGEGGDWKVDVAGHLTRLKKSEKQPTLSLFTPEDLKRAEEEGELDVDSNLLDLRPDPMRFVRFLKSIERSDISSELFVRLLEAYKEVKAEADADPLRTLLYLQLILQMQNQLAAEDSASNILSKPDHILSFIKHALESARPAAPSQHQRRDSNPVSGLRMEDLRIVQKEEEEFEEGDSDDEAPDSIPGGTTDDEMVATAVNLFLSILEAHPDLSARTAPILNEIFSLLEPLAKESSDTVRPLAREARMVMTARLASASIPTSKGKQKRNKDDEESPQETYQKALKLLQDPLLPVRAHGLLLLRQLVSMRKANPESRSSTLEEPAIDRALVPGILSIFLQSVQDDDSYMFLNAVQGLAAMVNGFGRDVLKGLVNVYAEGLDGLGGTGLTQQDVDVRTRVGEALGQVIRRCGDALPAYASMLVPRLFGVMRAAHYPTTLRTSAVALLAQCVKTNELAILPYAADLSEAMVDLLQVETVPAAPAAKKASVEEEDEIEWLEPPTPATMDAQPTSTNSKFPPLRRAALHFLSLLIQACTARLYESSDGTDMVFPPQLVRRTKTTLGYVAATDEDAVVRVMARETLEGLDQLAEAMMGI
ncbi:hypothetical protein POSPLADRAFT_1066562 [Postia placenta MAD-698-R-SB12]|uniref:RNA polymerase II assembly factor Rtp1 C-terminal domain-containing protein n=1 Tax=Postia placenta MAD-698-R-SB12 TaxID=670580 RepID=A0A1X6MUV4_9APHY|nr:hypothetical protein POSPLADRAFT_1066562 [Postia placenta MAD-698-R-SB12]OSX60155.1 hypothetical protein POSPLADRAFT_1066562 [Postia placenta MAD-698-R-SB12]